MIQETKDYHLIIRDYILWGKIPWFSATRIIINALVEGDFWFSTVAKVKYD